MTRRRKARTPKTLDPRTHVTVLCGMELIRQYLGVSRNTVLRWEREYGLPIRRNPRPVLVLADLAHWGRPGETFARANKNSPK
jgi:hypothetical protein